MKTRTRIHSQIIRHLSEQSSLNDACTDTRSNAQARMHPYTHARAIAHDCRCNRQNNEQARTIHTYAAHITHTHGTASAAHIPIHTCMCSTAVSFLNQREREREREREFNCNWDGWRHVGMSVTAGAKQALNTVFI